MAGEWPEGMWEGARWFFLVRDIHWVLFETKNDGVVSGTGTGREWYWSFRLMVIRIEDFFQNFPEFGWSYKCVKQTKS